MARATRLSTKKASMATSASATPISYASSTFDSRPESVATDEPLESPATSEEDDEPAPKTRRASLRGLAKGKRAASSDLDGNDVVEVRPPKRRAVSHGVFVSLPQTTSASAKSKGKGKAQVRTLMIIKQSVHATKTIQQAISPSPPRITRAPSKGKGKVTCVSSDDDEGNIEESDVVEVDESDSGESVFEPNVEQDEEDEEIMLQEAIRESIRHANGSKAGSSSARKQGPSAASVTKAKAAERRLTGRALNTEEDEFNSDNMDEDEDEESDAESLSDIDSEDSSGDDEPLSAKLKAKKKNARFKRKKKTNEELAAITSKRKEERALADKLGRRLTYAERSTLALHRHHPELRDVWGDLESNIPIVQPRKADQPENLKVTLLPFQQESLFWMREQEKTVWAGGMLADEMGMGKTIQIISLIVSDGNKPNLVVAPTVAVMQWRNEINTHTTGMKVLVWHGSTRETNHDELKKYDVVITTYSVMESCFRKQEQGFKRKGVLVKEDSPVHRIHWNRIILDEAHNIKERSTNTAKAAFELKGDYRWCLSGTPLQNRVGELYSLVRFLGGDPFAYYFCKNCDCKSLHWKFSDKRTCDDCHHSPMHHTCFWNNEILTPIQKHGMVGPGQTAFKKLRILLDRMMLRRTKLQRADDLGLPPRTVIVRKDYFSPEEKELYLSLFSDAKRQFSTYLDQGTVLNNYSNIFSLLTRMRQMACHPDLVLRSKTNASKFIPDEYDEATVCRICNDIAEDAIQSKCRHIFDRECIRQYLESTPSDTKGPVCPVCHLPLTIDLEAAALEIEENDIKARQGILGRLNLDNWRSSSKIEALVEELSNLRLKDATTKSLVFSQFVNFLDLIAFRLQRAGFKICRLEGTMSPQARDATIKHFMNSVDVTVFLVSLKAGGVALNLTEASRVYLMDSWWNPAVEYQAMDRIHRLGQKRPVEAIKLVVEDSIESRIVQLQEKKSAMVDATLSSDDSAMGRLTPEDLGFLFRL
ncbi:SNF2 family N-terminal domain-containing protein [Panaeolus papilionaceus]|nr:SNF2 family N-terminal domain-containing protein [Panaeolus papilionaceus]